MEIRPEAYCVLLHTYVGTTDADKSLHSKFVINPKFSRNMSADMLPRKKNPHSTKLLVYSIFLSYFQLLPSISASFYLHLYLSVSFSSLKLCSFCLFFIPALFVAIVIELVSQNQSTKNSLAYISIVVLFLRIFSTASLIFRLGAIKYTKRNRYTTRTQ